ncbi:2OG-Fe(II) oxygenase [Acetobacter estunensis]|nr:2OG-Fe(II) oxygenase [Acetobacter estunensis]
MTGRHAPFCYGMAQDNSFYSFDTQAGRNAVVLLAGHLPASTITPFCEAFSAASSLFARHDTDIVLLVGSTSPYVPEFLALSFLGVTTVFCMEEFFAHYGFSNDMPESFVMDRAGRIITALDMTSPATCVTHTENVLAALISEKRREVGLPAPLLLVPHVFDAAFCHDLIDIFERSPQTQGGMASTGMNGKPVHRIDENKKKRTDFLVPPDSDLARHILERLDTSCVPEIKKAFQFEAQHVDRLVLARYDAPSGHFLRHRDNLAPAVMFRKFALSLNLNTSEYDGGFLTFPEYNDHYYKPQTGAAIIFSASLLHEATPVTRGSRYCLLTFFH